MSVGNPNTIKSQINFRWFEIRELNERAFKDPWFFNIVRCLNHFMCVIINIYPNNLIIAARKRDETTIHIYFDGLIIVIIAFQCLQVWPITKCSNNNNNNSTIYFDAKEIIKFIKIYFCASLTLGPFRPQAFLLCEKIMFYLPFFGSLYVCVCVHLEMSKNNMS